MNYVSYPDWFLALPYRNTFTSHVTDTPCSGSAVTGGASSHLKRKKKWPWPCRWERRAMSSRKTSAMPPNSRAHIGYPSTLRPSHRRSSPLSLQLLSRLILTPFMVWHAVIGCSCTHHLLLFPVLVGYLSLSHHVSLLVKHSCKQTAWSAKSAVVFYNLAVWTWISICAIFNKKKINFSQ